MKKIVIYYCSCFSYSFSKNKFGSECLAFFVKNLPPPCHHFAPAGSGLVPGKIINERHPIYTGSPWGNVKVDEDWNCSPSSIFRSDTFMQCLCFPKISSEELFIPRTLKFWQSHKTAANQSTYLLAQQLLQEFVHQPWIMNNPPRSVWCPCQCWKNVLFEKSNSIHLCTIMLNTQRCNGYETRL